MVAQAGYSVCDGFSGCSFSRSSDRNWRINSAGSRRKSDVSRGLSTICCALPTDFRESSVSGQVLTSIILFGLIYLLLLILFIYLLNDKIQHGPAAEDLDTARHRA